MYETLIGAAKQRRRCFTLVFCDRSIDLFLSFQARYVERRDHHHDVARRERRPREQRRVRRLWANGVAASARQDVTRVREVSCAGRERYARGFAE